MPVMSSMMVVCSGRVVCGVPRALSRTPLLRSHRICDVGRIPDGVPRCPSAQRAAVATAVTFTSLDDAFVASMSPDAVYVQSVPSMQSLY